MTALSVTAVRATSDTDSERVKYGATVAAGNPLYLDTVTNKYKLGINTGSTTAAVKGIALTPGVDDGYGLIAKTGSIYLVGPTMTVGETYFLGAAGEIVPTADVTSSKLVTRLGTASTANTLKLSIEATGITHG